MSLLGKIFGGVKKVASVVNPLAGAGYDAVSGKGAGQIGKNFVGNNITGMKASAALLPMAMTGGAAGAVGGAGGGGGILSSLFSHAPDILGAGGAILGGIQGAKDQAQSDKYRKKALGIAESEWAAGAPLRDRARSLAMQGPPQREDLSSMFRSSNPFR